MRWGGGGGEGGQENKRESGGEIRKERGSEGRALTKASVNL